MFIEKSKVFLDIARLFHSVCGRSTIQKMRVRLFSRMSTAPVNWSQTKLEPP